MLSKISAYQAGEEGSNPLPSHQSTFDKYVSVVNPKVKPYLQIIKTKAQRRAFNNIIETHHSYVTTTKYGGRRINWIIRARGTRRIMGIIGVGSAIMAMKSRDRFIGWNRKNRIEHLINIANNWRYCLLPDAPKNFGSQVLSLLCKLAPKEWEKKYGDKLILLETLVEPPHKGTVYKASNWYLVGITKGTGYKWISREEYPKYKEEGWSVVQRFSKYGDKVEEDRWQIVNENSKKRKLIFVKPLVKNFRQVLRAVSLADMLKKGQCIG